MNHATYCKQFVSLPGSVLDVGSGKGKFVCEMAAEGFTAYGVEINQAYIDESERIAKEKNVKILISKGNAEELPFSENNFDFINCAEVTEHVEDPVKVCREIYRVLKPGKSAYISFHNRWGWYDYHYHLYGINWLPRRWTERILKLLKRQKEDGVAGRQKLTTMHYYTYGQISKLLKTIGFSVEDARIEKIKNKFPYISVVLLPLYCVLLRPVYFNSFHVRAIKPV